MDKQVKKQKKFYQKIYIKIDTFNAKGSLLGETEIPLTGEFKKSRKFWKKYLKDK